MFIANSGRFWCALGALVVSSGYAAGVPDNCTQLIVGIAPDWNSMRGEMQLFERSAGGDWSPVSNRWPVLFGKHGLAWGSGLAGQSENGLRKTERDGRAPAGIFQIGKNYTLEGSLSSGGCFPFHPGTTGDPRVD